VDLAPAQPFDVAAYAAPLDRPGVGLHAHRPVTPASVFKIQVALAVEEAIAAGRLDGAEQRVLAPDRRTPGPVGISLLRDEVRMSVRDLVSQMLTVSDNVATDELLALVGLPAVNDLTAALGLPDTRIVSDLRTMRDGMAAEAGFPSYEALPPEFTDEIRGRIHASAALDPARGSRTTAIDTVRLLQAIWTDRAATPVACAAVRRHMANQLTRHRIASGFPPDVRVAAKSGGLMGVVRNEAGVVAYPDGGRYAVAVFTRTAAAGPRIDVAIGRIARALVEDLR
jgi:beta-lactamase class A